MAPSAPSSWISAYGLLGARPGPHHDQRAGQTDRGSDHVAKVRPLSVNPPSPQNRKNDEHRAIRGVGAPERVLRGLERRHDAVQGKSHHPTRTDEPGALMPEPQPDQVPSADLEETGDAKKNCRSHGGTVAAEPFSLRAAPVHRRLCATDARSTGHARPRPAAADFSPAV